MKSNRKFYSYKQYSLQEKLAYYEGLCDTILLTMYEKNLFSFNTLLTRTCHIQRIAKWQDLNLLKSMYNSIKAEAESRHIDIKQALEHYRNQR